MVSRAALDDLEQQLVKKIEQQDEKMDRIELRVLLEELGCVDVRAAVVIGMAMPAWNAHRIKYLKENHPVLFAPSAETEHNSQSAEAVHNSQAISALIDRVAALEKVQVQQHAQIQELDEEMDDFHAKEVEVQAELDQDAVEIERLTQPTNAFVKNKNQRRRVRR